MTDYTEKASSFQNHLNPKIIMYIKKFEATGTCSGGTTRVSPSATEDEENIVGFTGYRKKLDIISIAGMGGLGKTTLATTIFHDSFVEYHFDVRGWVTVSQAYSTQDMLLQLLALIGKSINEAATKSTVSKLCEMLYQSLKGRRYLIIIDDIWTGVVRHGTMWDNVFQMITMGGFTHNLQHLTQDQSWELLCRKTFRGYECPESLTEPGKRIAKKCGGLPLALVVIAGLLEKEEKRKDLWENIAERVGSFIINDPKGCLDTLALSYGHLPCHLKKCFLYVGGFPEDYKIQVRKLIRLWMAEGFIEEPHTKEAGKKKLSIT
ncbi:putative P-loop containing nucleoside triphosphate hydrolase [Helianthus anomalus]